jgi:hypothetical protein
MTIRVIAIRALCGVAGSGRQLSEVVHTKTKVPLMKAGFYDRYKGSKQKSGFACVVCSEMTLQAAILQSSDQSRRFSSAISRCELLDFIFATRPTGLLFQESNHLISNRTT